MKIRNAVSKLNKCGYICSQRQGEFHHIVTGIKDKNKIVMYYHDDQGQQLEYVEYNGLHGNKKVINLTQALKALGEVKPSGNEKIHKGSRGIIKSYVKNGVLPIGWMKELNVQTESQIEELGDEIFKVELRSRKRYSYKASRMIDSIRKKFKNLWEAYVNEFVKEGGIPIHSVTIKAPIDSADVIRDRWGGFVKNEAVIENIPVFSSSREGALSYVSSIIGPMGTVDYNGVKVIDFDRNASLNKFFEIFPRRGDQTETQRIVEIEKRIADHTSAIENCKKEIKLSTKKIEMIKMIDVILSTDLVS